MSYFDQANKKAMEGSPRVALGTHAGMITDITQKDINGSPAYEVGFICEGGKGKITVWYVTEKDVDGRLLKVTNGDKQKAVEMYTSQMARYIRLYTDLGLPKPETERDVFARLGELRGRQCTIVAQENKAKPDGFPICYVNAPRDGYIFGNEPGYQGGQENWQQQAPAAQQQGAPPPAQGAPAQGAPQTGSPYDAPPHPANSQKPPF